MGLIFSTMTDDFTLFDMKTKDYIDPNIDAIILNEMEKGNLENFYIKYNQNLKINKGGENR